MEVYGFCYIMITLKSGGFHHESGTILLRITSKWTLMVTMDKRKPSNGLLGTMIDKGKVNQRTGSVTINGHIVN